jgi:hypothetical protein
MATHLTRNYRTGARPLSTGGWAFNNVRSIIPVAEIEHVPDGAAALPEAPIPLETFELRLPNGSSLNLDGPRDGGSWMHLHLFQRTLG